MDYHDFVGVLSFNHLFVGFFRVLVTSAPRALRDSVLEYD